MAQRTLSLPSSARLNVNGNYFFYILSFFAVTHFGSPGTGDDGGKFVGWQQTKLDGETGRGVNFPPN